MATINRPLSHERLEAKASRVGNKNNYKKELLIMLAKKYYSAELDPKTAEALKMFLKAEAIYFEPSACYNLVHFEIKADETELKKVNDFLDTL